MAGFIRRCLGALLVFVLHCEAYSVLTHEQLIDLTWNASIRPLLQSRYPGLSAADLRIAHSYAYGGCAIQDLGYYPFGKPLFSDLTHYVRTGDFIESLLRQARNADEFAFALGALSHYVGDTVGHQEAINPATSLDFPKLARKFGPSITYDENPRAHVRTEFGLDIDQLSKHRLAPGAYLRFIGLNVSRELLERAFFDTYSLHLRQALGTRRPTFRSYWWSVRSFLPRIAYAETVLHRDQFRPDIPDASLTAYEKHLADADFQTVWNQYRRKPGFKTYFVATLLRIVPKIGPLSDAKICVPTDRTEQLYIASVNRALDQYNALLKRLRDNGTDYALVANRNLDTGRRSSPGEYPLTDRTYAQLLGKLSQHEDRPIPAGLRAEILEYYSDPASPITTKDKTREWARVQGQVKSLRDKGPAN